MDIQSRVVRGEFWHGVGTEAAWRVLMHGGGLRLPEANEHAHDPGDYGLAVYFTDLKARALPYAARVGGRPALVRCKIELENALIFDWRSGSPLDPKHPTNVQTEFFEALYGNPVRGVPEARHGLADVGHVLPRVIGHWDGESLRPRMSRLRRHLTALEGHL